jgi:hypothetical protein
LAIVTAWDSDGSEIVQGVKQVWPCAVRTSAAGGFDSNRTGCNAADGALDDIQSGAQSGIDGNAEQPASATPRTAAVAATIRTRDMTLSVPKG